MAELRDLFGTGDPDEYRKKLAAALTQQGTDASAIRSPWQGAARLAQALTGSMMMNDLASGANQDRIDQANAVRIASGLPPLGGQSPQPSPFNPTPSAPLAGFQPPAQNPPQANPQMPVTPPMFGNRPKVMPTDKMWGDDEAVAAGLYDPPPQSSSRGVQPQSQPMQMPQPPQGTPSRMLPQMPPEVAQQIDALTRSGTKAGLQQAQLKQQPYLAPKEQEIPLTDPRERAAVGIQPTDTNPYTINSLTRKITPVNPQPFAVNVNQQGESEFQKEAGKVQAKRFDELAGEAPKARQMLSDISMLRDLGTNIGTGKWAQVKATLGPYADALGIKVDGLEPIQAYEAIVNRVAPGLRVAGTGSQSDFELRNFLKSLPSLGNTPGGNEIIQRTLEGLYNNKMRASEIGSMALTGEITRKEAEKRLRELPDPMEEWRQAFKAQSQPQQGQPQGPQGAGRVRRYNPDTGQIE